MGVKEKKKKNKKKEKKRRGNLEKEKLYTSTLSRKWCHPQNSPPANNIFV